jgi:phage-related tail protein
MPRVGEITGDDLKAQLNEYHVLVAEVIGGLSAELTGQANRITAIESQTARLVEGIAGLQEANRLLLRELMALRKSEAGGS